VDYRNNTSLQNQDQQHGIHSPSSKSSGITTTTAVDPQQLHWYHLNAVEPEGLVKRAHAADQMLRTFSLRYHAQDQTTNSSTTTASIHTQDSLPHRLPSISILAEAAFAPLTGVSASSVRKWADEMVLAYLHDAPQDIINTHSSDAQLVQEYNTFLQSPSTLSYPKSPTKSYNNNSNSNNTNEGNLVPILKSLHQKHMEQKAKESVTSNLAMCLPVRPCGYVFRRGDIAWNCRTCQADPTCVLCDSCFTASDHEGHEVFFHRTSPGGCCDCGDIEAWRMEGCCPKHRPRIDPPAVLVNSSEKNGSGSDNKVMDLGLDSAVENLDFEAVKTALRGKADGETYVKEMLPPRFAAALGVVIGVAVNTAIKAVDGTGIGSDPVQWTRRWADQVRKIIDGRSFEEEYSLSSQRSCAASISDAIQLDFPPRFNLSIRLHNDDIHTFEEVNNALYENRHETTSSMENETDTSQGLVMNNTIAQEMTQHVDSDGQVTVRTYKTFAGAMAGYQRLKDWGLQASVLSRPQIDLELRARLLLSWLIDIADAHPAVAALVVHALVDVSDGTEPLGGIHVWSSARMLPPWSYPPGHQTIGDVDPESKMTMDLPGWRRRMDSYPPHLRSSYLTREEATQLHQIGFTNPNDPASPLWTPLEFAKKRGADVNFYSRVPYLLPSERHRKSPHALWGTMPAPFGATKQCVHPSLYRQIVRNSIDDSYSLLERVLIIDTDLRKQQEADTLIANAYPHKLIGLHMVSGVGLIDVEGDKDGGSSMAPGADDWRDLLSISSYQAPPSPLLLFLLLDPYPPKAMRERMHKLFLSLLIDSRFKSRFAASLGAVAYRSLTTLYCAGVGCEGDSPMAFTVQIFTAGSLVRAMCNANATRKLLGSDTDNDEQVAGIHDVFTLPLAHNIVRCLHMNLLGATKEVRMVLKNTNKSSNTSALSTLVYQHGEMPLTTLLPAACDEQFLESRAIKHRKILHLLRDLEYVFETPGTALRLLLSASTNDEGYRSRSPGIMDNFDWNGILSFPSIFCRLLRIPQGMDPLKRKTAGGHVEYETPRWMEAFSLTLNFSSTRDALIESYSNSLVQFDSSTLNEVRGGMGNLFVALLCEIKWWLYKEGVLETGLPMHRMSELQQNETGLLQRSTLHVSYSCETSSLEDGCVFPQTLALSCATHIKISENNLDVIENALQNEQSKQNMKDSTSGSIMGDWLRVPHSPLGGDLLTFHIPLHRSFARTIKSICSIIVSNEERQANPNDWWKLPILDDDINRDTFEHPLSVLLKPALKASNCKVSWSAGPDCSSEEAQRRRKRSRAISAAIASAKIIHSLCDHPLRCIVAAEQINRYLWARNGSTATGMAVNYVGASICRDLRDLDLTMVQFSASGLSVGLGVKRVFSLITNRFNLDGYLCDPEKRSGSRSPTSNSSVYGSSCWVKPPRMQDPDHAIPLTESFFSTICALVSELPLPSPLSLGDDSMLRMSVRRELIHALAVKPHSHNDAVVATSTAVTKREENDKSGSSDGGPSFRKIFSNMLQEVAKRQVQGSRSTRTPMYELKSECSDEYDPTYFHLRRAEHQTAMDTVSRLRKQKMSGDKCLPLVCAPPPAHPRFMSCRLILHIPAIDAAIRRILLFALSGGQWLPPEEPSADTPDNLSLETPQQTFSSEFSASDGRTVRTSIRSRRSHQERRGKALPEFSPKVVNESSVSFLEVLQILTLQIHTLEACALLHTSQPSLDGESKQISAGISINSYLERLVFVPPTLVDVWALRCKPDGPLGSKGSGSCRGSMLGLLIALYEHRSDNNGSSESRSSPRHMEDDLGGARFLTAEGLKWILRFINALVDGAQSVREAHHCASEGIPVQSLKSTMDSSSISWSIDERIKSIIGGMLANLPNLWPKEDSFSDNNKDSIDAVNRENRKAAQMRVLEKMKQKQATFAAIAAKEIEANNCDDVDNESDLCIICRCDDENSGPLGYLGHIQRSRNTQLRCRTENEIIGNTETSKKYRVVGDLGCQVRESMSMDSAAVACIPYGSIVTVTEPKVKEDFDLLTLRVFVHHESPRDGSVIKGWANINNSQGYVILSPLTNLCYTNSRWGSTRPIILQCGHAAHLSCVETHVASIHQKAQSDSPFDGRFAADIKEGEFLCPLCKQLTNVVVPTEKYDTENADQSMESSPSPTPTSTHDSLLSLQDAVASSPHEVTFDKAKKRAIDHYGTYLYQAMQVFSWDSNIVKREKQQSKWHKALKKWDFEEDASPSSTNEDDLMSETPQEVSVGDLLRLFRQQHIAWATAGHTAAAAEASTRGLRQVGFEPATSDPWVDFDSSSRDTHPMLLELRRTITAASASYTVLCNEITSKLSQQNESTNSKSVTSNLLVNIMYGKFWTNMKHSNAKNYEEWSILNSLLSSTPCHVSRDETLSLRQEARATAAAMWLVKRDETDKSVESSSTDYKKSPPTPLAVNQIISSSNIINKEGGTMDPNVALTQSNTPFKPALASGFFYIPLLSWDLTTFAGAIFSTLLSSNQRSPETLATAAQLLIVGRIVQVLSTPNGFLTSDPGTSSVDFTDSAIDVEIESASILSLWRLCQSKLGSNSDPPDSKGLLSSVSLAILPFARTLVLLLRASMSVLRQNNGAGTNKDKSFLYNQTVLDLLESDETMFIEDAFYILKGIGGPTPSEIINQSQSYDQKCDILAWSRLINDWLDSVVSFEAYHGSQGNHLEFNSELNKWIPASKSLDNDLLSQPDMVISTSNENIPTERYEQQNHEYNETNSSDEGESMDEVESMDEEEEEDSDDDDEEENFVGGDVDMAMLDEDDSGDEEMEIIDGEDIDDLQEFVVLSQRSNAEQEELPNSDELSQVGTSSNTTAGDDYFANISSSSIIPYQSSVLGTQQPGPGPRGRPFEYTTAATLMSDMSHLGMVHSFDTRGSGLIRLPRTFVELYSIVNQVKMSLKNNNNLDDDDNIRDDTAVCLLTGTIMRSGSPYRRNFTRRNRSPPGTCTLHARKVGSGTGIFFLLQKCIVLLVHNKKSAYSASVYVDENDEEDTGLKRGRPLFLKEERYKALEAMWRQHGIPREVAQIRSTSDRVIRDNWY